MSRKVRSTSSLLVGILALGLVTAPARAQQPEGKPAGAAPAAKAAPKAPRGHLWWNDDEVVAKLSLSAEQRKQMDARFEKFETFEKQERTNPFEAREAFHAALRQGKLDEAQGALSAWADSESAQVRASGGLKLEVLSLLSAEQRKQLQAIHPNLAGALWVPRPAWRAPPLRQGPPAPR